MAFKKQIRNKESRYYYCDFWIGNRKEPGSIHVNKSTKETDYTRACKIEEQWRQDAEEQYFNNQDGQGSDDMTLREAIDYTFQERREHNASGGTSLA